MSTTATNSRLSLTSRAKSESYAWLQRVPCRPHPCVETVGNVLCCNWCDVTGIMTSLDDKVQAAVTDVCQKASGVHATDATVIVLTQRLVHSVVHSAQDGVGSA